MSTKLLKSGLKFKLKFRYPFFTKQCVEYLCLLTCLQIVHVDKAFSFFNFNFKNSILILIFKILHRHKTGIKDSTCILTSKKSSCVKISADFFFFLNLLATCQVKMKIYFQMN